ncbi:MAG TPA: NAD(P)-dependent alcohol dehydrogenase, partial [Candidatus Synoicihabitans sp.]|nr:NAD(P)-dependent alcohol dehydrogenase [Candidatus Synoicihabitans sp.]
MNAWQLSSNAPHGLELVQRPCRTAKPAELIVRLKAASLNYRDLMVRRGDYVGGRGPIIPAADGVGEVVEVGEGVTRFKVGDRVTGNYFPHWSEGEVTPDKVASSPGSATWDGVLADYFTVREAAAVTVPAHLSDAEAATLSCAGVTAWNALFVSYALKPGETVLLLGTGGVSLFALQFAKLAGARVIITSSDDAKLERARHLGADHTINYRQHPDWEKEVLALTRNEGVDLVVDTVA